MKECFYQREVKLIFLNCLFSLFLLLLGTEEKRLVLAKNYLLKRLGRKKIRTYTFLHTYERSFLIILSTENTTIYFNFFLGISAMPGHGGMMQSGTGSSHGL